MQLHRAGRPLGSLASERLTMCDWCSRLLWSHHEMGSSLCTSPQNLGRTNLGVLIPLVACFEYWGSLIGEALTSGWLKGATSLYSSFTWDWTRKNISSESSISFAIASPRLNFGQQLLNLWSVLCYDPHVCCSRALQLFKGFWHLHFCFHSWFFPWLRCTKMLSWLTIV